MHVLHHSFLLILGGSLCEDLGLFHSFKTSPRSSNSEFVCQSYHCFSGAAAGCSGYPVGTGPPCPRACTVRMGPRGHGVSTPVGTGCPEYARWTPTASFLVWLFKGFVSPPVWGLFLLTSKHHFEPLCYLSQTPLSPLYVKGDLWMVLEVIC